MPRLWMFPQTFRKVSLDSFFAVWQLSGDNCVDSTRHGVISVPRTALTRNNRQPFELPPRNDGFYRWFSLDVDWFCWWLMLIWPFESVTFNCKQGLSHSRWKSESWLLTATFTVIISQILNCNKTVLIKKFSDSNKIDGNIASDIRYSLVSGFRVLNFFVGTLKSRLGLSFGCLQLSQGRRHP